jgi:HK97 family phage portal protein
MFPFISTKKNYVNGSPQRRNSPENPSTSLSNPDTWLWESFGASQNGISVNANSAPAIPAFWQAVSRISNTIGAISCKIYRRTEFGSEADTQHPLYPLLTRQPHPLYNAFDFFKTLVINRLTSGIAYAEIIRNKADGSVQSFQIHKPKNILDLQVTPEGNYFFIVSANDNRISQTRRPVALSNMIWLKGWTYDGITCLNPLEIHEPTLGSGLAATLYAQKFYENGAHINYAVEVPFEMSPSAKSTFTSIWKKLYSGIRRAFSEPLLLDKGAKLHPLKMTPVEAQMLDSKNQTVEDVARIADIPPHMLGAGKNFTFSSIEVMNNDFVKFSLRNITRQLEIELENKCLTRDERDNRTHEIRFNLDTLLQGDTKTRSEKMINEFKWGLIDKNEYRRLNDYNAVENGNYCLNPVNMFVSETGEMPENPALNDQQTQT